MHNFANLHNMCYNYIIILMWEIFCGGLAMNKTAVGILMVVLAYAFAFFLSVGVSMEKTTHHAPEAQLPMNVSQKYANIQLLNRYGYISNSELQPLYDHPKSDMSLEEYSSFLDQFLEGMEAELLEIYCKYEIKED